MTQVSPLDIFWFIPVTGDGSYLGSDVGTRPADFHYLKQIAQAADRLGFGGALIPVGAHCEDPWITAAALAPHTERLRFLAALRPGLATPTQFARQAAALDRISDGRFLVNLVSGGDPKELAGEGIFLSHDERYAHAAEFLTVFNRLLAGETVDFDGRYQKVKGARLLFRRHRLPSAVPDLLLLPLLDRDNLGDQEIGAFAGSFHPRDACRYLVHLANLRGGLDNIAKAIREEKK